MRQPITNKTIRELPNRVADMNVVAKTQEMNNKINTGIRQALKASDMYYQCDDPIIWEDF